MSNYTEIFLKSFGDYAGYVWGQITFTTSPWYENYFWWLILISVLVWGLELAFPWRKNQAAFRKDFWMDAFFMIFNFYIFNLIIFIAFSKWLGALLTDLVGGDLTSLQLVDISGLPNWLQLIIFFLVVDFIQWFTHVLLHRIPLLWEFHKVHHSVEEMGFAAHLRYHWMENVFYTPMKYIVIMAIGGFAVEQAFIVHFFAITIGHLNHANLGWDYGPLKYILNNPKMHIWHHAYAMPKDKKHGINFGITLSIWDYLFRTNHIPSSGRDIRLGFPGIEKYPNNFFAFLVAGFKKESPAKEK